MNLRPAGDKKIPFSYLFGFESPARDAGLTNEGEEKGTSMERIIDEALRQLKARVGDMVGDLLTKGLSPQTLSKFEHELHGNLGEFGRLVEQAVLEKADIEKPSIELEGQRHYKKYKGPQEYQCLFGKIAVTRSVYQANGERTMCPLEVNAGILHHHLTPAAAEFVAYATAHMVPGELAEFCRRWQYLTPSETVIKQVAGEIGEMAEMLQEVHEEAARKEEGPLPAETAVVTISRDGTSVNIREEGWRQAQVGAISLYGPLVEAEDKEKESRRGRLRTVYLAQMPEEKSPSFDAKFDREVEHTLKGLPEGSTIVCLADGSLGIWRDFEEHPQLKDAVHINDFWHAAQYLAKAGKALFGDGSAEAEEWFRKYRRILKEEDGGVESVVRSIRYFRKTYGTGSGPRAEAIHDSLRFFTRNRERMQYADYRRQGLPIGSGVVEAACKTVVGQRFKRAGMRWSIEGGQNILNLRVLVLSKRWDAFWKSHAKALSTTRIAA